MVILSLVSVKLDGFYKKPSSEAIPIAAGLRSTNSGVKNGQASNQDQQKAQELVSSLSSPDEATTKEAVVRLVILARASEQSRRVVLQGLLEDIRRHDALNGKCSILGDLQSYWESVTKIFVELSAVEGIDIMIEDIHCQNGLNGNESIQPAFDALISLGKIAVPKLSAALASGSVYGRKTYIIACLGTIGGSEARLALKRALRSETDISMIREIRLSIAAIDRDARAARNGYR
jgi:hypothetical protein